MRAVNDMKLSELDRARARGCVSGNAKELCTSGHAFCFYELRMEMLLVSAYYLLQFLKSFYRRELVVARDGAVALLHVAGGW